MLCLYLSLSLRLLVDLIKGGGRIFMKFLGGAGLGKRNDLLHLGVISIFSVMRVLKYVK